MNNKFIKINNKTVQVSEPYEAVVSEIIGRDQEMIKILASWMRGSSGLTLAPLLIGEPGIGKNRIVYECARMCSKALYIYQGHEDVTAEDLICSVRFSDDTEKKMDYIVSPLITAMIKGGICFIDEIAKIRPRALAPLSSLLDERGYLDSTTLGERIYAHPGFRFIAATNTGDLEGNMLPDFIRSRMRPVISVDYPNKEEIEMIIKTRFQSLNNNGRVLLDRFWKLWNSNYANRPPEPRDSIYIFGLALNLADLEISKGTTPLILENKNMSSCPKELHLEQAFEALHGRLKGKK
jgi:MoxR-like ATPase